MFFVCVYFVFCMLPYTLHPAQLAAANTEWTKNEETKQELKNKIPRSRIKLFSILRTLLMYCKHLNIERCGVLVFSSCVL